jgi:hypothetical protein
VCSKSILFVSIDLFQFDIVNAPQLCLFSIIDVISKIKSLILSMNSLEIYFLPSVIASLKAPNYCYNFKAVGVFLKVSCNSLNYSLNLSLSLRNSSTISTGVGTLLIRYCCSLNIFSSNAKMCDFSSSKICCFNFTLILSFLSLSSQCQLSSIYYMLAPSQP